jgi:hypothetical protein
VKGTNAMSEPTEDARKAVGSNALLALFGFGPRTCEDCGREFSPPPYMECRDWKCCESCAVVRFWKWAQTDEGRKAGEAMRNGFLEG